MYTKVNNKFLLFPTLVKIIIHSFLIALTTSVNDAKDHWPVLNEVLNEYTWPIRFRVVAAINEILNDPQVYKVSKSCNSSLSYFATGLQENREDAFRCK